VTRKGRNPIIRFLGWTRHDDRRTRDTDHSKQAQAHGDSMHRLPGFERRASVAARSSRQTGRMRPSARLAIHIVRFDLDWATTLAS
jgi:hypothetical protein